MGVFWPLLLPLFYYFLKTANAGCFQSHGLGPGFDVLLSGVASTQGLLVCVFFKLLHVDFKLLCFGLCFDLPIFSASTTELLLLLLISSLSILETTMKP